eukprot:scaffold117628_cov66-Phaeocystis_antarctica.AAC.1
MPSSRLRRTAWSPPGDFASEHPPPGNSEPTIREAQTSLCDRGRVYGPCPTTTARFLRVAVTYTRTHWGRGEGYVGEGLDERSRVDCLGLYPPC